MPTHGPTFQTARDCELFPVKRTHSALLVALWMVLLLAGSLLPWWVKAHLHTFAHSRNPEQFDFHRLIHILIFGLTTVMVFAVARRWWAAVLLSISLGFLSEYLESVVYPNHLEWADIRDDSLGTLVGLLVLFIFFRLNAPSKPRPG